MRKDKEKVLDEVWTEDHIRSFLQVKSHDKVAQDYHMLLRAYQSMREEDFSKFVNFFLADGRDINCRNPDGQNVLSIVQQHRTSSAYRDILLQAGASD